MRQTSRAVALLLAVESAQAAAATLTPNSPDIAAGNQYFETVWMPLKSEAYEPETTTQLNSRTAGYNGSQQLYDPTVAAGTTSWELHSEKY
jgi:hypothetical protein